MIFVIYTTKFYRHMILGIVGLILGTLQTMASTYVYPDDQAEQLKNTSTVLKSLREYKWCINFNADEELTESNLSTFQKNLQHDGYHVTFSQKNYNNKYSSSMAPPVEKILFFDVHDDDNQALKLYNGKYFNVYAASKFFTPDHILIISLMPKASFLDLKPTELQELCQIKQAAIQVFLNNSYRYDGYTVFHDSQKSYGSGNHHFCLEIIPARDMDTERNPQYDLLQNFHNHDEHFKIQRIWSLMFDSISPEQAQRMPSKVSIENLQDHFINHIKLSQYDDCEQISLNSSSLPWYADVHGTQAAKDHSLTCMMQYLQQTHQISFTKITDGQLLSIHHEKVNDKGESVLKTIDSCGFCEQDNIDRQCIGTYSHQGYELNVLYCLKPYVSGHHLLIVPTEHNHVETWHDLSAGHKTALDQLTQILMKAMQQQFLNRKIMFLEQVGIAGGQTCPHFHRHLFPAPNFLNFAMVKYDLDVHEFNDQAKVAAVHEIKAREIDQAKAYYHSVIQPAANLPQ